MKLGKFLKDKYPEFSQKELKRSLENGACEVNGLIEIFASREINPGKDKIKFNTQKFSAPEKLVIKKSHIVFEDDDLLVYNKEAGHACMATESKTVNLHEELKKSLALKFLEPSHRLDKNTSGLMIFSKNQKTLKAMMQAFKDKKVEKTYHALVDGKWTKAKTGTIKNYFELEYKKAGLQKWKVSKVKKELAEKNSRKYKAAETFYKVLKLEKNSSLVELKPKTGRTHQLRIHLAYLGYPILGDALYATKFKSNKLYSRHLLHASKLSFLHPRTSEKLLLQAVPDFCDFSLKGET